jgi:hypothetical protein
MWLGPCSTTCVALSCLRMSSGAIVCVQRDEPWFFPVYLSVVRFQISSNGIMPGEMYRTPWQSCTLRLTVDVTQQSGGSRLEGALSLIQRTRVFLQLFVASDATDTFLPPSGACRSLCFQLWLCLELGAHCLSQCVGMCVLWSVATQQKAGNIFFGEIHLSLELR